MAQRPSLCILLVEDDRDSLLALARLLTLTGHRPLPAGTAAEALRLAASQRCDVVVSDVGLPDRSGLELMRELAALYRLPGIAVSGYTEPADVKECERAGFARHLNKPLDFQQLIDTMYELCRAPAASGPQGFTGPDAGPASGA
jgi:CheY-like chemotaxis protein